MKDILYALRDWILGNGYRWLIKPIFFIQDPETVHNRMIASGHLLGRFAATRGGARALFGYHHPSLNSSLAGMPLDNPLGLAAGFDKEGLLTDIMPSVGFGFMTVGSVTGSPTPGNAKPRLWRLKKSQALVVHLGLNSSGSETISRRWSLSKLTFPVAVSIAKANIPVTDDLPAGIADYVLAAKNMSSIGVMWEINISCPNTSGGEPFTQPDNLDQLLTALTPHLGSRPAFIKLPSSLRIEEYDGLIAVAQRHTITGFVCTNLSKDRSNQKILDTNVPPKGGISGKVVEDKANEVLSYVYRKTHGTMRLIGTGGIFTADDAYKKIRLGASAVQLITGMIYRGPSTISEIKRGLVRLLHRDGYTNISQAVGADHHARSGLDLKATTKGVTAHDEQSDAG